MFLAPMDLNSKRNLVFVVVVQKCFEELRVIEELLEDPKLAELEKCDAFTLLYHVEGISLHGELSSA